MACKRRVRGGKGAWGLLAHVACIGKCVCVCFLSSLYKCMCEHMSRMRAITARRPLSLSLACSLARPALLSLALAQNLCKRKNRENRTFETGGTFFTLLLPTAAIKLSGLQQTSVCEACRFLRFSYLPFIAPTLIINPEQLI